MTEILEVNVKHKHKSNVNPFTCHTLQMWSALSSAIPGWSHTFVEIDHEIISTVILLLWLIQEYKQNYVHEVLVNAQEKVRLGELAISTWP